MESKILAQVKGLVFLTILFVSCFVALAQEATNDMPLATIPETNVVQSADRFLMVGEGTNGAARLATLLTIWDQCTNRFGRPIFLSELNAASSNRVRVAASGGLSVSVSEPDTNVIQYTVTSPLPLYSGNGSPEGVVVAVPGSLYSDLDGGDGFLWFKLSGTTNTGWVNTYRFDASYGYRFTGTNTLITVYLGTATVTNLTVSSLTFGGETRTTWPEGGSGGVLFTNANTLYVDSTYGNDSTAILGRVDKPYASLTNAIRALQSNQRIFMAPGVYYITPTNVLATYGVLTHSDLIGKTNIGIYGSGPSTRIIATAYGDVFCVNNVTNAEFADFQVSAPILPDSGANDQFGMFNLINTNRNLAFRRLIIDGGMHGITHLRGVKSSAYVTIEDSVLRNFGCTNHVSLTYDGSAISGIGTDWVIQRNQFEHNLRDIEIESLDAGSTLQMQGVLIANNRSIGCYYQSILVWPNATVRNAIRITIDGNSISNMVTFGIVNKNRKAIYATGGFDYLRIVRNTIDTVTTDDTSGRSNGIEVNNTAASDHLVIEDNFLRRIDNDAINVTATLSLTNISICRNKIVDADPNRYSGGCGIVVSGGNMTKVDDNIFWNGSCSNSLIRFAGVSRWAVASRNFGSANYTTTNMPLWGIRIDATSSRIGFNDNVFQYGTYQIAAITNNSTAAGFGLPSRVFSNTAAPDDTNERFPNGTIWVGTNGLVCVRSNSTWQIVAFAANVQPLSTALTTLATNSFGFVAPSAGQVPMWVSTGGSSGYWTNSTISGVGDVIAAGNNTFSGSNTVTGTFWFSSATVSNLYMQNLYLTNLASLVLYTDSNGLVIGTNRLPLSMLDERLPYATNLVDRGYYVATNCNGLVPSANGEPQVFHTNASYTITGIADLRSGYGSAFNYWIWNTGAAPITVTFPASFIFYGSTNALTIPADDEANVWIDVRTFTNAFITTRYE